jgi:hypothetical protein
MNTHDYINKFYQLAVQGESDQIYRNCLKLKRVIPDSIFSIEAVNIFIEVNKKLKQFHPNSNVSLKLTIILDAILVNDN